MTSMNDIAVRHLAFGQLFVSALPIRSGTHAFYRFSVSFA